MSFSQASTLECAKCHFPLPTPPFLNCLCWDGPKALSFIEDRYKETTKAQGKRPETLIAKSTPLDYENERPRAPRNKLCLDSTFGCSPFEQPLSGAATYRYLSCFVCIRFWVAQRMITCSKEIPWLQCFLELLKVYRLEAVRSAAQLDWHIKILKQLKY